ASSLPSTLVYGRDPAAILRRLAANGVEVDLAHLCCDRSALALADGAVIDARHRRDLSARAAEEDLIGDIQLGAVNLAYRGRDAAVRGDLENAGPGDALEDVVGSGGRDQDSVANEEEVLRASFAHVAILRQDDRLVEAGLLRLGLRERSVHVRAGDLAAGRDRVVVGTPPARDAARDAAIYVDVGPERDSEDREAVLEVMETNSNDRARFVGDRPDVRVLAVVAFAQELEGDADEIVRGVRKADPHDPAGAVQPEVMLL